MENKNEWKKVKLKEISINNQGTYGISASAVPYDSKLPTYLRITDINDDGTINKKDLKSVDNSEANKYFLKKNDVVFARTGNSTGKAYLYREEDGKFVYAGFLIKFSLDEIKVNPKYIGLYLMTDTYKNWVNSISTGSTRNNINAKMYGDMEINLPSRELQDKIVKIIEPLNNKIELNNKINNNLEEQCITIFKKMFPQIFYGSFNVGNYLKPKRGKNLLSKNAILGDIPVVAGGLEPAIYHNKSNTQSPVITISASGANAGFIRLWHTPVWSSDSSYIDYSVSKYIYFWYLFLKLRQKEIYDLQSGSAQPHIYPKHLEELSINKLDIKLIETFDEITSNFFEKIGKNNTENNKLTNLKNYLLPKLMNGEIDVENIEL